MRRPASIQLSIPKPCTQDWGGMQHAEGGKYCTQCQHSVVDFSGMRDEQIVQYLKEKGAACGRFQQGQLNRVLQLPVAPKKKIPLWTAAVLIAAAVFKKEAAQAQMTAPALESFSASQAEDSVVQKKDTVLLDAVIEGVVKDENNEELINATVLVEGTRYLAVTDYEGRYELRVPSSLENVDLLFNFQGKTKKYITIPIVAGTPTICNAKINTVRSLEIIRKPHSVTTGLIYLEVETVIIPVDKSRKSHWQKLQFWKH